MSCIFSVSVVFVVLAEAVFCHPTTNTVYINKYVELFFLNSMNNEQQANFGKTMVVNVMF